MKYDLYANNVLIRLPDKIGGTTLRLIRGEIQDFTIDGHAFVAIEDKDAEGNVVFWILRKAV